MSDEVKNDENKESSTKNFFKKIGSVIGGWLKSSIRWIIIGILGLIGFSVFKKVDTIMDERERKKKEEAKQNLGDLKVHNDEVKEKIEETKTSITETKEEIKKVAEEEKKAEQDYVEKQKETAKKGGFTKK